MFVDIWIVWPAAAKRGLKPALHALFLKHNNTANTQDPSVLRSTSSRAMHWRIRHTSTVYTFPQAQKEKKKKKKCSGDTGALPHDRAFVR